MRDNAAHQHETTVEWYTLTRRQAASYKRYRRPFGVLFAFVVLCGAVAGIVAGANL